MQKSQVHKKKTEVRLLTEGNGESTIIETNDINESNDLNELNDNNASNDINENF